MGRTILIPSLFNGPKGRALAILSGGVVIAAAAAFIDPFQSRATPVAAERMFAESSERTAALNAAKAAKWPAFLGTLTGDRFMVDVYIARNGPLYTVKDLQGQVLATQLDSEEVYARFPELQLNDLHADTEPARD